MDYPLKDILDIPRLQHLLGSLEEIQSLPSAVFDKDGAILIASAWQDICVHFHRTNPETEKQCKESDRYIESKLEERDPIAMYRCPMGLVDAAMPIVVEGEHLGNIFVGQVFTENPNVEYFLHQARKYGFEENNYLAAVDKVPVLPEQTLYNKLSFIHALTQMLAEQGLALRRKEEAQWKFKALFESSPIGVAYHQMIYDESGKAVDYYFIDANEQYKELTGVDPRGKKVSEIFPDIKNDVFDWIGTFDQVVQTGNAAHFEQFFQLNNRWYDGVCYRYKPEHFVVVFREITEQKEMGFALKKSERRLSRAEQIAQIGNWSYEVSTDLFELSEGLWHIFGQKPQKNFSYSILRNWIREDFRAYHDSIMERMLDLKPGEKIADFIYCLVRPDGSERWIEVWFDTEFDQTGKVIRFFGTAQDITAKKAAEENRKSLETQLRQKHKIEAIGIMAGGIAHNFNNNLAIILGNLELAGMKLSGQPDILKLIGNARTTALRSRDLVAKILSYSDSLGEKKIPLILKLILDETYQLLASTLPNTVISRLEITDEAQGVTIVADPTKIQEALLSLCNNAAQAMDEQGTLSIILEIAELKSEGIPVQYNCSPGRYAKLSIQDTGCGIDSEIIDKIFDPFFTTKEVGQGTGMGLATVHGIVSQLGGMIKVKSQPSKGSCFELYFPIIENV